MKKAKQQIKLTIERIANGGDGVGFDNGIATFVPLSAPGDVIEATITKKHKRYQRAVINKIIEPSPSRVDPICPLYQQCGGCQLQQISETARHQVKQQFVIETMERLGRLDVTSLISPTVTSTTETGYRRRANLKVQYIKREMLIGFFAKGSNKVIPIDHCPVLHPSLNQLLPQLPTLINSLPNQPKIKQVDIFCDESGAVATNITAIESDQQMFLTVKGLKLEFKPGDFTQVNYEVNQLMVGRVLEMIGEGEVIWDLFCGIGNFSLPLAFKFKQVFGVEGYAPAVQQAEHNAKINKIKNIQFTHADLFSVHELDKLPIKNDHTIIADPPREGAPDLAKKLSQIKPKTVVWIACDPASLARDSKILTAHGMKLVQLVPLDMFPMTAHVETIALLK